MGFNGNIMGLYWAFNVMMIKEDLTTKHVDIHWIQPWLFNSLLWEIAHL